MQSFANAYTGRERAIVGKQPLIGCAPTRERERKSQGAQKNGGDNDKSDKRSRRREMRRVVNAFNDSLLITSRRCACLLRSPVRFYRDRFDSSRKNCVTWCQSFWWNGILCGGRKEGSILYLLSWTRANALRCNLSAAMHREVAWKHPLALIRSEKHVIAECTDCRCSAVSPPLSLSLTLSPLFAPLQ